MGRYCCSCSASGRCISCSCVKAGKKCRNCTPGRNFSCGNRQPGTLSSSQPSYTSIGECSNEVLPSSLPSTARINTTTEAEPNPRGVPSSASQCSAPAITGNVFQSSCRNDTAESESESDEFDTNTAGSSTTRTIRTTHTTRSTAAIGVVIRDARIAAESVIAASPDIHENRSHLSIAPQTPGTQRQDRRPAEDPRSAVSDQDATRILPEEHCADYIASAYERVVQWRRNLFIVPLGKTGERLVAELARLVESFVAGGRGRPCAWTAVVVACHILLQKPNDSKLDRSSVAHLDRRLDLWKSGKIEDLMDEARCIQTHLTPHCPIDKCGGTDGVDDTLFSKLVFGGKIRSAIRLVCSDSSGGVLAMDDDAGSGEAGRDVLLKKHPVAAEPPDEVLLDASDSVPVNPILYEKITPELIKRVGREMQGSSGPSGLDSEAWKRMLTCYGRVSNRLCTALALAARSLCTEEVNGHHLSAFTAARLIPLDKSPGVRPIAVGEVFRRIIGKAVARVVERDVLDSTAPLQLCVGVPSACEAAIHAMDSLFRSTDVEAILLVDASNAFNALNRKAAMHNIPVVCPALGRVFENTYRQPCRLFVAGGGEIASQEGTCQGDPLAMAAYAVAVMPLIKRLSDGCPEVTQAWFADDDSAAGRVEQLRRYWGNVLRTGPGYGYHPNPAKTVLLVKPEHFDRAQQLFGGTGVQIRTDGCRYLGGALGSVDFRRCFLEAAIGKWEQELSRLCTLAATQPHAAYTTLVKGILSKWRFTLRAMECPPELFAVLDTVLS